MGQEKSKDTDAFIIYAVMEGKGNQMKAMGIKGRHVYLYWLAGVLCTVCLLFLAGHVAAGAERQAVRIAYVTISDGSGEMVLCHAAVTLTDENRDGKLTVNDVLWAAHEDKYPGGAAAGYLTEKGDNGESRLLRMWGEDVGEEDWNVALNNDPMKTLDTRVEAGDHIQLFHRYAPDGKENLYTYFSVCTVTVRNSHLRKADLNVTARYLTYDENQLESVMPLVGVTITANGMRVDAVTDARGRASLDVSNWEPGVYVISAYGGSTEIVPPLGIVQVPEPENPTEHRELIWMGVIALVTVTMGAVLVAVKRRSHRN